MEPALNEIPFLADAPEAALWAAHADAAWFTLPGGSPLFLAGEPASEVYFALSGTLAAFGGQPGNPHLHGFIRAGEPVGEMAFLEGAQHANTVYAMRDSELVAFTPQTFERLADAHPPLMRRMAALMVRRQRSNATERARSEPKIYALLSTSPTIDLKLRAHTLRDALAKLGRTSCVVGEEAANELGPWFDALEQAHDIVFLASPIADTPWFRVCLRQADRIWILARGDAAPSIPLLPQEDSIVQRFRLVDLVMLHHPGERRGASTDTWRRACGAQRVYHWRSLQGPEPLSLARVLSGTAVALVLSGGGARAYAHLGVIRALHEEGVPIDAVGGSSMGAVVAACLAMGWDDDEIERRIRQAFVESNPLADYVLPVISLSRGRRVEQRLIEHFGDALIEDLALPFFSIATDLVSGKSLVHRTGLVRDALRASISLPGILPPVVAEDGSSVLVDGAVLSNFPVDVMAERHRGPIVGVDVAERSRIDPNAFRETPDFVGWVSRRGLQSVPPIVDLLMRAATINVNPNAGRERVDVLVVPDIANVELVDWKRFEEAVEAGYRAAQGVLKEGGKEALLPAPPARFKGAAPARRAPA